MSSKNLEKVIQRAISDAAFRRLLQSNPEAALRGFKLTSEEVTAIRATPRTQKVKWAVSGRAKDSRRPLRLAELLPA